MGDAYMRILYVLKDQEAEAERLGAKRIPGDCRWMIPGTNTDPVAVRELGKFRTEYAMQSWVLERVGMLAPDLLDRLAVVLLSREGPGVVDRGERVYLHVPRGDLATVRRQGAQWDSHRRRAYLEPGQKLEPFRRYLTSEALSAEAHEVGKGLRHRSKIAQEAKAMAAKVNGVTDRLRRGSEMSH